MTEAEIGELVLMLQAISPLGLLSWMQAQTIFDLLQQRGYRIDPPASPPERQPKKEFQIK
jgi:hypothetical protein